MKKSIFTIAFVAVAAISANAFNPILWHKTTGAISVDKTTGAISVDKTVALAQEWKTIRTAVGRKVCGNAHHMYCNKHGVCHVI